MVGQVQPAPWWLNIVSSFPCRSGCGTRLLEGAPSHRGSRLVLFHPADMIDMSVWFPSEVNRKVLGNMRIWRGQKTGSRLMCSVGIQSRRWWMWMVATGKEKAPRLVSMGAGRRLIIKSLRKGLENSGIQDGIFSAYLETQETPTASKIPIFSIQGTWIQEWLPELERTQPDPDPYVKD